MTSLSSATRGRVPARLSIKCLAVLTLLSAIAPLASDMHLPAFPQMANDFGAAAWQIQLTMTTFLLGLAIGQLIAGPLSDRYGRRPLLLAGASLAAGATLLCVFAPTVEWFIFWRLIQGFGGAAGIVLSRAIISDTTTGAGAARLFSVLVIVGGLAPVVAPLMGAGILIVGTWRSVFWVLFAVSLLMLLGAALFVPETLPRQQRHAGGLATVVATTRRVVKDRVFIGYAGSFAFSFAVLMAYIPASPFVLQNVLGLSPTHYAIVFAINSLSISLAAVVAARLTKSWSLDTLVRRGLFLQVGATACVLAIIAAGAPLWPTLVSLFFAVAGFGFIGGAATALTTDRVPYAIGTGASILGAAQFGLGALVSPLVGIWGEATALPMAIGMASAACFALLAYLWAVSGSAKRSIQVPPSHAEVRERRPND